MPTDLVGVPSTPLVASSGGAQLTISAILKQPTFVQAYLLSIADYLFVSSKMFRPVQGCPSGALVYYASTPVFANSDAADLAEREEIPSAIGGLGLPSTAISRRKGLAIEISEQMRDRNDVDALNIQLNQVTNTVVRSFDKKFMTILDANVVTASGGTADAQGSHLVAAAAPWATSGATVGESIQTDIANAAETIVVEERGFTPGDMLIDQSTYWNMIGNVENWYKLYVGNVANLNPQFLGKLPGKLAGMTPWVTLNGNIPAGSAYVFQQGIFGGISDERPLRATPWVPHEENETWKSFVTRAALAFVDQPLAIAKISGVR